MEILIKMSVIIAWMIVVISPIFVAFTIHAEIKYKGSLAEQIDALGGQKATYTHNNVKIIIAFVVAIVYLFAR